MTVIVTSLSVAQAATVINAAIAIVQYSLPLLLAVLLIHFMPRINTALVWNSINPFLHSTLWPTILRADSDRTAGAGLVIKSGTLFIAIMAILLAVASVILPLGLQDGPPHPSPPVPLNSRYVQDTSALALSTTALGRDSFTYGSKCPLNATAGCDPSNVTSIPPYLDDIFGSTPQGAFSIQYRQFYNTEDQAASSGYVSSAQLLMLRNDTFAVEGIVVDMSATHPGLGFINHTIPILPDSTDIGGTWTQDVLFLEPVTSCVDTNLTFEYVLVNGLALGVDTQIEHYYITDRGGFYNLPNVSLDDFVFPSNYNGQDLDLTMHAYFGAVFSNQQAMSTLNTSQTDSFPDKTYNVTQPSDASGVQFFLDRIIPSGLDYYFIFGESDIDTSAAVYVACTGFGGMDPLNIDTAHVECGVLFGPPLRTDGGDNNIITPGSTWMQSLHACASATRASIQTFTFSVSSFENSTIQQLNVTREPTNHTVLWGMENTNGYITESYPLWGHISDEQQPGNTSAMWTIQSDHFMLPATSASFNGTVLPEGSPQNAHAPIWSWVYGPLGLTGYLGMSIPDYTGRTNYAIKSKWQDLVLEYGQETGSEMILNLIWTDIMSNQLVGSMRNDTLGVSVNAKTLEYDFRYATLGYLLVLIWLPVFVFAGLLLVSKQVRWSFMKAYFNHLSIGRVVTRESALGLIGGLHSKPTTLDSDWNSDSEEVDHRQIKDNWTKNFGQTRVRLDLDRRTSPHLEMIRLMYSKRYEQLET